MPAGGRLLALSLMLLTRAGAADPAGDFRAAQPTAVAPAALAEALAALRTPALVGHLAWLSDPLRQGRGLGSLGLAATAAHLAEQLGMAGLTALGAGGRGHASWFQPVPLRAVQPGAGELRSGGRVWRSGSDFAIQGLAPDTLTAPVVYAGWGIREPGLGHDDYRDLEIRGRIVLFRSGTPPGAAWRAPALAAKYAAEEPGDRHEAKLEQLASLGALAALAVEEDLPARLRAKPLSAEPFFLAPRGLASDPALVRVGPELAAQLLGGRDGERPGALGIDLTLHSGGRETPAVSLNVLAVLPGSDPVLGQRAVVLGAHMDHLGQPGGVLHPGADDNASGVSALLEIARAFAALGQRPRRTLVFAFWTGEEEGKFGSGHYLRNPVWPLARTDAYLNLDMIGHPWTRAELAALVAAEGLADGGAFLAGVDPAHFAEPGYASFAPKLAAVLAEAGRLTGMALHLDRTDGRNGGSDYRDFARREVPFVRFFGSYFPAYHQPGDTLANLDPGQVQRMARLALATAWLLAER